ncbi:hypothetical protein AWN76_002575 [Rhodothermaceae bacterium RA]|nr:hypothetical protein AWN76_002575 [Rhodothermaceae bacterium RA]
MPHLDPEPPRHTLSVRHFYALDETVYELALHEPATRRALPEAFVQDLWQHQRIRPGALRTTTGAPVEVLHPGAPNPDGGPDFLHARLRIGELLWCGDVEVHVDSSAWFDHRHHTDPRYNSVVLHVALYPDMWTGGLLRADGAVLQEVTLYRCLEAPVRRLLHDFHTRPDDALLCAPHWPDVPADLRTEWIDALAHERLEEKTARLEEAFREERDLEALLYRELLTGLGYAQNAEPMAELARRVPLSLARRYADPLDLEALLAGTAGLLPEPSDLLQSDRATVDYVMDLRHRFERLAARHGLEPMTRVCWQFFRLRPANFPPLRLAQAAALLAPGGLLHDDPIGRLQEALTDADPLAAMRARLQAVPGPFWQHHVRYETTSRPHSPALGTTRIDALLVNAVIPVMRLWARREASPALESHLLGLLRRLPATPNAVTRLYGALGTRPSNAWESHGLLHLHRTRCRHARCLSCPIGRHILIPPAV